MLNFFFFSIFFFYILLCVYNISIESENLKLEDLLSGRGLVLLEVQDLEAFFESIYT